jgi:hypothetical protein
MRPVRISGSKILTSTNTRPEHATQHRLLFDAIAVG